MTNTKKTTVSKDTVTKVVEANVAKAVDVAVKTSEKVSKKAASISKEQVAAATKAGNEASKSYDDYVSFSTANFDAALKASTIMMQGVQDISKAWASLAETSFEKNAVVAKKFLASKSVDDVAALQDDFTASFEAAVVDGQKLSDMGAKLAETASVPLKSRMDETVAIFTKAVAA